MESFTMYTWNEFMALLMSVIFGSGAYISFVNQKKIEKVNLTFIITVLFLSIFAAHLVSEWLKLTTWGEQYRNIIIPLISFFGYQLIERTVKELPGLFKIVVKKVTGEELETIRHIDEDKHKNIDDGEHTQNNNEE